MPAYHKQGYECRHSRQHTKSDGNGDLVGAPDRGFSGIIVPLQMAIDILTGDDSVVDDDAKDQNEREQTDQVYGHPEFRKQRYCTHETDRDSNADPNGHGESEKQSQQNEYQQSTLQGASKQRVQAKFDDTGSITPKIKSYTLRHGPLVVFDVLLYCVAHANGALIPDPVYLEQDCGLPVQ